MIKLSYKAGEKRRGSRIKRASVCFIVLSIVGAGIYFEWARISNATVRLHVLWVQRECFRYENSGQIVYAARRTFRSDNAPHSDPAIKWELKTSAAKPSFWPGPSVSNLLVELITLQIENSRGDDPFVALHRMVPRGGRPVLLALRMTSELGRIVAFTLEPSTFETNGGVHLCRMYTPQNQNDPKAEAIRDLANGTWLSLTIKGATFDAQDESHLFFDATVDSTSVTCDAYLRARADPNEPVEVDLTYR